MLVEEQQKGGGQMDLTKLLKPKSVAVIGASEKKWIWRRCLPKYHYIYKRYEPDLFCESKERYRI